MFVLRPLLATNLKHFLKEDVYLTTKDCKHNLLEITMRLCILICSFKIKVSSQPMKVNPMSSIAILKDTFFT